MTNYPDTDIRAYAMGDNAKPIKPVSWWLLILRPVILMVVIGVVYMLLASCQTPWRSDQVRPSWIDHARECGVSWRVIDWLDN